MASTRLRAPTGRLGSESDSDSDSSLGAETNSLLTPASIGVDFGSHGSKITFAYRNVAKQVEIHRIPIPPDSQDQRPYAPSGDKTQYQFPAIAALVDGQLIQGLQCLYQDQVITLKSIFTHRAIGREDTIAKLPGGPNLLRACELGQITSQMEDDVLRAHFTWLCETILREADEERLIIKTVVLTHPNYLCNHEQDGDFLKYKAYYLQLLRPIWAQLTHGKVKVNFEMVSEGQAAALYICESFHDPSKQFKRKKLWNALSGPGTRESMHVLVPDNGSSTLNIQTQDVYFDGHGNVESLQSSIDVGWQTGAPGGSHFSNSFIEELIHGATDACILRGDIGRMLRRFEEVKWTLDWNQPPKVIELLSEDKFRSFRLYRKEIKATFDATFGQSLQVLKEEVHRVLRYGKDFVVVFCGGSYCNASFRKIVDDYMVDVEQGAQPQVKHAFLYDYDYQWASAVSVGAAVSVFNMPSPRSLLTGSMLGIQRVWKDLPSPDGWVGENRAMALFQKGCGQRRPCPEFINMSLEPGQMAKFRLVVHPLHLEQNVLRNGRKAPLIIIPPPGEVVCGLRTTYDLGWDIPAAELPHGTIRFAIEGNDIELLQNSIIPPNVDDLTHIRLQLSCYLVRNGKRLKNEHERRWRVTLKTEPSSKSLAVEIVKDLSDCCDECELTFVDEQYYQCQKCIAFNLCEDCFNDGESDHPVDHKFTRILQRW